MTFFSATAQPETNAPEQIRERMRAEQRAQMEEIRKEIAASGRETGRAERYAMSAGKPLDSPPGSGEEEEDCFTMVSW